jgi:hypothetical protein
MAGTINRMDEFVYQTDTKFHEPVFSGITYFTLPDNLTPSIDYSDFMSMSYTLEISVKRNKLLGTAVHLKVPITIGTMGPGIRTPTELKTYRVAQPGTPSTRNTTPAFVPRIEYEDCLPEYDDCRLPTYQAVWYVVEATWFQISAQLPPTQKHPFIQYHSQHLASKPPFKPSFFFCFDLSGFFFPNWPSIQPTKKGRKTKSKQKSHTVHSCILCHFLYPSYTYTSS